MFMGPEGVAAAVKLTPEQLQWYEMTDEAAPHITLAVHTTHQAKDLGSVTKRLRAATDWTPTQIPHMFYSVKEKSYKLLHASSDTALLEHRQIERFHGREKTDHPDAAVMLDSLASSLWSTGPTDVGYCSKVTPVVV